MWVSEETNWDSEKVEWVTQATKWKVKCLVLLIFLEFLKTDSLYIGHCLLQIN